MSKEIVEEKKKDVVEWDGKKLSKVGLMICGVMWVVFVLASPWVPNIENVQKALEGFTDMVLYFASVVGLMRGVKGGIKAFKAK